MDDEKFKELMDELCQSCKEVRQSQQEFEKKLTDLQTEVTSAQQKTSKELAQRITKFFYQFQRKGHEKQFNFNSGVQESITAARSELAKMTPAGENDKEVLKKATASLNEGTQALATRQKHIQLADRSEYGWATVKYYEDDPLAADSDDEKCIKKAEKKAQREVEKKVTAKRRRGSASNTYRRPRITPYPSEQSGSSSRRDVGQAPAVPLSQGIPRVLGPYFRCGAFGHLVATCTAKEKLYPFCQPVVSSAEPVLGLYESNTGVVKVADMSAEHQRGVDEPTKRIPDPVMCEGLPMTFEIPDVACSGSGELGSVAREANLAPDLDPGDITSFGRLNLINYQCTRSPNLRLAFWREVLHAPPLY